MIVPKLDAIADTSFVVGMVLATESKHASCLQMYRQLRRIGLLEAVFAELAFMLTREGGIGVTAQFFGKLQTSKYVPLALESQDYPRIGELLSKYADSEIDFVDIAIVATAERLKLAHILTLDQRDFRFYVPHILTTLKFCRS